MAFELFKKLFGASTESERRTAPRLNAQQGTRVLVIDDSATIVAVLGKMLRQAGYDVLKAGDAESGLEIARSERPDLIFLDIVLPGMNGFAALRQLRRDPGTQKTPIIMISGNMQATEQYYAQRIGADDFMKKPFGRGEVFTRLQKLIESGRLQPQPAPTGPLPAAADEGADIPDIGMPDPRDLNPTLAAAPPAIATPPVTERPDV
jgi:DNA-binding response OmpR family regulator